MSLSFLEIQISTTSYIFQNCTFRLFRVVFNRNAINRYVNIHERLFNGTLIQRHHWPWQVNFKTTWIHNLVNGNTPTQRCPPYSWVSTATDRNEFVLKLIHQLSPNAFIQAKSIFQFSSHYYGLHRTRRNSLVPRPHLTLHTIAATHFYRLWGNCPTASQNKWVTSLSAWGFSRGLSNNNCCFR